MAEGLPRYADASCVMPPTTAVVILPHNYGNDSPARSPCLSFLVAPHARAPLPALMASSNHPYDG